MVTLHRGYPLSPDKHTNKEQLRSRPGTAAFSISAGFSDGGFLLHAVTFACISFNDPYNKRFGLAA